MFSACQCLLGIQEMAAEHSRMIAGIGTDGASANIELLGYVEKKVPWFYWSWCLAHHCCYLETIIMV